MRGNFTATGSVAADSSFCTRKTSVFVYAYSITSICYRHITVIIQTEVFAGKEKDEFDFDSGEISTGVINLNEINYTPIYSFSDGEHYSLEISYTTTNLYKEVKVFNFMIIDSIGAKLNAELFISPENELGRMKINLTLNELS